MKTTPKSATIFATAVVFLLAAVESLGSGGTTAVTHGGATVCGIVAGEATQRIKCYQSGLEIDISPDASFDSISGGRSFLCGLRRGGAAVICWEIKKSTPESTVRSKRIYSNRTGSLTGLSVGEDHACALKIDSGEPICWRGVDSPEKSPELRSLTSGNGFSCGIVKSNWRVVCWGRAGNAIGESIEARFGDLLMSSLIAGDSHACGLTTAGDLVCGGQNDAGQSNPPSGSTGFGISGLALGSNFSCGIERSSGFVTCWGGKGTRITDSVRNVSFESLVAGSDFVCGLVSANLTVVCFGPGFENRLKPLNSTVGDILGTILPGPCVRTSCGTCPTFPDSENLCGGFGNICRSCRVELPVAIPIPPATSPAKSGPTETISKSRNGLYLSSLVVGSIGAFLGLCSVLYCFFRAHIEKSAVAGAGDTVAGAPARTSSCAAERTRTFSFSELEAATGGFSPENRIGGGSFGHVYRGTLADGRGVAVKRGHVASAESGDGAFEFESELTLLSRVHHKHLVGLIGFCHVSGERILVYEYMPNGSLHDHLHRQNDDVVLAVSKIDTWKTRISILLDAARGVEYLHSYAVPPIIHRDIKSSNILLDSNWAAKVSDFGLSLMGPGPSPGQHVSGTPGYTDPRHVSSTLGYTDPEEQHVSTPAVGTLGYIDPEYYVSRVLTTASDVYGLGVVMFEALTGRRAVFVDEGGAVTVVEHAGPWAVAGMVGRVLDGRVGAPGTAGEAAAVEVVAAMAVRCVEVEGKDRPEVGEVVASLERAVALCEGRESNFSAPSSSFLSSY